MLNLAHTLSCSTVNGPGERFTLWVQGCPFKCPGCWNPDTWAFVPRELRNVEDLAAEILSTQGIEGVTFTGGEPFSQARALALLAVRVQAAGLSVFAFTGYELEELILPEHHELLSVTDILVTGRYLQALHTTDLVWRGSSNQQVHFITGRYGPDDLKQTAEVEFHLAENGTIAVTGFPAPDLLAVLSS